MKKSISFLYMVPLLLFILFSFSCGGGGGGGTSSSGSTGGYLSGNWSGQVVQTQGYRYTGALNVTINQTGSNFTISGSVTNSDYPGSVRQGAGTGTISNSTGPGTITFGIGWTGSGTITFNGNYTDTMMSGNYTVTDGSAGTFSLTKASGGSTPPPSTPPPSYIYSLRCGSSGFTYNECTTQARISSIGIVAQNSYAACTQGVSWGYFDYQSVSKIWVNNGCDATFGYNSF
jgi:hypothetical protein